MKSTITSSPHLANPVKGGAIVTRTDGPKIEPIPAKRQAHYFLWTDRGLVEVPAEDVVPVAHSLYEPITGTEFVGFEEADGTISWTSVIESPDEVIAWAQAAFAGELSAPAFGIKL